MVCKEEVITWFKDLDSYRRIDMLCELLNVCVPFELRFVGSYLEEQGKHTYHDLRQQSLTANDLDKLEKDALFKNQTLVEETVRHRILLNISLLKSRNYNVANWYSKKFLRTDYIEDFIVREKDDAVHNELLLLFTMASKHPAFSFDQKQFFTKILVQLCDLRDNRIINKASVYGYPPGFYPINYRKVYDNNPFPINIPMQPPGLPLDFASHFRSWPGFTCGAPSEVPPFPPHQPPMHPQAPPPPQPSTSPLVRSPCQSRNTSPHRTPMTSRPPLSNVMPTPAPSVALPPPQVPLAPCATAPAPAVMPPPPGGATLPMAPPPVVSIPTILSVPVELTQPIQLTQSSQTSPIFCQPVKQPQSDSDELNTTLKEESPSKAGPANSWIGGQASDVKQINGLRVPSYPPTSIRTSIADQMQAIGLTDESSHYHSSSSNSSPLQTPPDTPSNLPSNGATPNGPGRGTFMDKNRVNGVPGFLPPFGDTTSPPPPPPPAFTFPPYPMHAAAARYYATTGFRPPMLGQYGGGPQYQAGQAEAGNAAAPMPPYTVPYFPLVYSTFPAAPPPPRNPPGCYNCGAQSHVGQDCTQANIDEITQKKTYCIDYSPVHSDGGEK